MDNYQETFNTWNKVAKTYEDKFMDLDLYNDTYDVFLDLISKKNASILEIGCGPANISKYLLTKNPDLRIKGIDISENMVKLARKNNPSAEFEVMDIREIHAINEKFDAIVCRFCIPYCDKLVGMAVFFTEKMTPTSTKMNKLLFYADFLNYKSTGYSISGTRYFAHNHGPVPKKFRTLFDYLADEKLVDLISVQYPKGLLGEKFEKSPLKSFNINQIGRASCRER